MYSNKKTNPMITTICVWTLIVIAFFMDVIFGSMRIPIFTTIVCAIVTLYECISPYIYKAR